jgi:hypothetical protein
MGPRHLNEKSRHNYQSRQRAERFTRQIQEAFRHDHPELFPSHEDGDE